MDNKLSSVAVGIALAVTLAVLSALCATAMAFLPDATFSFFGAFMHGLDLNSVRSTAPMTIAKVVYGIVGLGIVGFIAGVVFAACYNATSGR